MAKVPTVTVKSRFDSRGLKKGAHEAQGFLGKWGGTAGKAASSGLGKSLGGMGALVAGATSSAFGPGAMAAATAGGLALAKSGLDAFSSFDKGMREVWTLLPDASEKTFRAMGQQLRAFSKDSVVPLQDATQALYQTISAGHGDNPFALMEVATMAAKGGVTDLTTAVDGITTVLNAYKMESSEAAAVSDLMFTAVRLGKTTFDEMAPALSTVVPLAAAVGLGFENVTASLSVMTAQGIPTSVAMTQIRGMLAEVTKEGTKANTAFREIADQTLPDFVAAGGNMADILGVMQVAADDSGVSLLDMFGRVEAGTGALALMAGGGEELNTVLAEMEASAGATEAAHTIMADSVSEDLAALSIMWDDAKVSIGGFVVAAVTGLGQVKSAMDGTSADARRNGAAGFVTLGENLLVGMGILNPEDVAAARMGMTIDQWRSHRSKFGAGTAADLANKSQAQAQVGRNAAQLAAMEAFVDAGMRLTPAEKLLMKKLKHRKPDVPMGLSTMDYYADMPTVEQDIIRMLGGFVGVDPQAPSGAVDMANTQTESWMERARAAAAAAGGGGAEPVDPAIADRARQAEFEARQDFAHEMGMIDPTQYLGILEGRLLRVGGMASAEGRSIYRKMTRLKESIGAATNAEPTDPAIDKRARQAEYDAHEDFAYEIGQIGPEEYLGILEARLQRVGGMGNRRGRTVYRKMMRLQEVIAKNEQAAFEEANRVPDAPELPPQMDASAISSAVAEAVRGDGRPIQFLDRDGALVAQADAITLNQFRDAPLITRHIRRCTGAAPAA